MYMACMYEVVTVIPYVSEPKMNVRHVTRDELDELLEDLTECAEFVVALYPVEMTR